MRGKVGSFERRNSVCLHTESWVQGEGEGDGEFGIGCGRFQRGDNRVGAEEERVVVARKNTWPR